MVWDTSQSEIEIILWYPNKYSRILIYILRTLALFLSCVEGYFDNARIE